MPGPSLLLLASHLAGGQLAGYGPPPPDQEPLESESGGSGGSHGHSDSSDPLAWLREAIPGEPGVDYPILSVAPETSFECTNRPDGMYADTEADCQAWHQCFGDRSWAFLCPNGTIFNQELFTCVWWFDFDCQSAEGFYALNEGLYEAASSEVGSGEGGSGGGRTLQVLEEELGGYKSVEGPTPVPTSETPGLYGAPSRRAGRGFLRSSGRARVRRRGNGKGSGGSK